MTSKTRTFLFQFVVLRLFRLHKTTIGLCMLVCVCSHTEQMLPNATDPIDTKWFIDLKCKTADADIGHVRTYNMQSFDVLPHVVIREVVQFAYEKGHIKLECACWIKRKFLFVVSLTAIAYLCTRLCCAWKTQAYITGQKARTRTAGLTMHSVLFVILT